MAKFGFPLPMSKVESSDQLSEPLKMLAVVKVAALVWRRQATYLKAGHKRNGFCNISCGG